MSIYKKIPAIMAEVGAIEKTRKGDNISYRFRGIDDVYFALQPLFAKHGVFCAPAVTAQSREERATKSGGVMTVTILTMEFTLWADDGSNIKITTVGEAMDTSDKSTNKAMSVAMKYAMLQLFCIPTQEDEKENDTEYHNPEPPPSTKPVFASPAQVARLMGIAKKSGASVDQVKALASGMGIASSTEIPKEKYDSLCKAVENWKPAQ